MLLRAAGESVITLVFANSHRKNKRFLLRIRKYKLLRAPVKSDGANSEENDQLARILARLAGQKELLLLPGCKAGSQGPGQSSLPGQLSGSQPPAGMASRCGVKRRTGKKGNKKGGGLE